VERFSPDPLFLRAQSGSIPAKLRLAWRNQTTAQKLFDIALVVFFVAAIQVGWGG
jgi:hypothetical protein